MTRTRCCARAVAQKLKETQQRRTRHANLENHGRNKTTTRRPHCTFWAPFRLGCATGSVFSAQSRCAPHCGRATTCGTSRQESARTATLPVWGVIAVPDEFLLTRRRPSTTGVAVFAFWPSAAGLCTARWQAGHRKLPKFSGARTTTPLFFRRPSTRVCNEVLLGSARGPALGTSLCGRLA